MEPWKLALGVIGATVGIFGLSFTVFWNIIKGVEKGAHARIDRNGTECAGTVFNFTKDITFLKSQNEQKITIKYADETYTRRKEHDLEIRLLNSKIDNLSEKIK